MPTAKITQRYIYRLVSAQVYNRTRVQYRITELQMVICSIYLSYNVKHITV